ncbi:zinc finger BED domain-containing protein RICESLEEPER 4-like isoform X2 [Primulina huaijiensis]|uniref:zinc finger BED domain-containing protein RICESLEEPER 4-like isoform X2 n=1 Tax=Primulina huaijiensis TaxID=1492673 RepID=UPI003CC799E7
MSTPNTLSAQESSTTPVMGGVQLSTNDENEASQSKNAVELDNIEDDDTNPYGPKKRKRTSKVWMDFKVITLADGLTKAECIHCKHRLAYNKNSGVTSHLIRHSKGCVRKKVNESGQKNLSVIPTISESETVSTVHNFKYDQAKIREILSHMIVVHELPFIFAEYELFNLLMKNATPHYEKISRATTRKDCITSYEIEKRKLMAELKQVNRVSVTTDLWRWNATYFMLSTALEFKDVFPRYQQRDPTYNSLPSDEDWDKVIVVCSFLEEFNEVTHIISGSEYPTSNLFLPELYNIKKLLKNTNVGEDSFMPDMIKKMKNKFDKY